MRSAPARDVRPSAGANGGAARAQNAAAPAAVQQGGIDGERLMGKLSFIDNAVDTSTGTIRLKATFSNADRVLWPGQFVNVKARLSVEQGRILVLSQTLQTGPQGKYVWVYNPGDSTVTMRDVTVLRLYRPEGQPEKAVIGTGLQAGEKVVSEGQMRLAPNAKVRLLTSAEPTS